MSKSSLTRLHLASTESAAAGVECRGARVPGLFYADEVALLSPLPQGLQQLLDTMQSFCVTNGLTISQDSQRLRWWCWVGATNSVNGMWGAIASSVVNLSFI